MAKLSSCLIIGILFLLCSSIYAQEGWETLFNGTDLSNFVKLNGTADYRVIDGMMVGTSKMNTPNTFLATKKNYGDFILEFDVKVENDLNSGVQFRSLSSPSYMDGRVHGYQCEIETSARKWAGGVYDEARRGWLYPLSINVEGQHAFRNGSWNHYRIEAIGNHIRTWVNGIMCANLVDDMTAEGFIAFQVHGIQNISLEGKQVMWKNIRIKTTDLENERMAVTPGTNEVSYLVNMLTDREKRQGWRLLWDGKTTKGWQSAKKIGTFPEKGWVLEDNNLVVQAGNGGESTNGGDIITTEKFTDFELELEFKLTEGANSGIKYFVDPELNKGPGSAIGLEFQILDDNKHPDAKKGVNGNRTVGSAYDLIRADNLSDPTSKNKRVNGIGSWNKARIVSKDGNIEHWLNNIKVVEFNRHAQVFKALVENSKYVKWPDFGQLPEGNILLQDHGDRVHFRSIKIREL